MSGWSDILEQVKQRHPFLSHLKVSGVDNFSSPLPEVLQISFDIVEYLRSEGQDEKHLAMVFPLLLACPEWIALGCSLASIKRDFLPNIERMKSFTPGQKLLLDNRHVVEYVREDMLYGSRYLLVQTSAKRKAGQESSDTIKWFRIEDRLRFQPTETQRRLTPVEKIDSRSNHLLDLLLDIGSFGNRSVFNNRIILVSHLTKVRQFAETTHIVDSQSLDQSVSLRDLFQWGGITVEGDLEQWGHHQIDAEPVIGVAPDLITLREYLFSRQSSDVFIIIDGDIPFINDLQALDEILSEGYHVVALMEDLHLDGLSHLEDRGFKTWVWSENDLRQLELANATDTFDQKLPFYDYHRTIQNFHTRQFEKVDCDCAELEKAAKILQTYSKLCHSSDPEIRIIELRFYYCLLKLSRLLRPLNVGDDQLSRNNILKDLELVRSDIKNNITRLERDAVDTAHEFVDEIMALMDNSQVHQAKVTELEKTLLTAIQNTQKIAIVLADASEVSITERYWKESFLRDVPEGVHFVTPSELQSEQYYDLLIVCGWLGTDQMRKLHDSCIAPSISVLTYSYEQKWFSSAVSRWRRHKENVEKAELSRQKKADYLQTKPESLLFVSTKPPAEQPLDASPETDFDITDFELRLHTYRRDLFTRPTAPGETETEARYVGFAQGRYAYLRPNHKVPVVTGFIAGHADESTRVPSKDIKQLKVGDYVVFREGTDSDLLRTIADRGLKKAGKGEHRTIAGLWKRVLLQYVNDHPDEIEGALVDLWDAGLQRTEITVRSWLNDDHRIGPQDGKDIEIIAKVCRSREIQEQLDYVRRAIKEVRGAHLQAAHFLAEKLIAQLPSFLTHGGDSSHTIEIEDIGQATVVQIEFIDEEDVSVPLTEVNRLFKDEF